MRVMKKWSEHTCDITLARPRNTIDNVSGSYALSS